MSPKSFGAAAMAAARAVPSSMRYGGNKVFISDAYNHFAKSHPGTTLHDFKSALAGANRERHLTLARADLPHAHKGETFAKVGRSETKLASHSGAEAHFIRLP